MPNPSDNPTLAALINLLDEPDETAFTLIREQILIQGQDAIAPLERCMENTFNTIVLERVQDIVRQLHLENNIAELSNWLNTGSSDLLRGFILVTKTQNPSLDEKELIISLEQLKMDIWIELRDDQTALESVKVMNHILFEIHHFATNITDKPSPRNNFIDILLESKKGSALSLGMLFIILAQKLGLPVYGVDLPHHFILAWLTSSGIESPGESDVLFYINPFSNGAVFTRRDIDLFISQMKLKPEKSYFAPCSNPDIIRRLIGNLISLYNQSGNHEKAEDLKTLLNVFK